MVARGAGRVKRKKPPPAVDGERLAYWGAAAANPSAGFVATIVHADGSGAVTLPGALGLIWSPTSQQLAFSTLDALVVADRDGANQRTLASLTPDLFGTTLTTGAWSRDGRWIAYRVANRTVQSMDVVRSDGAQTYSFPSPTSDIFRTNDVAWGRP